MNYLAHLMLADDSDASRIGNLLGDFTKGTLASLAEVYPDEIIRGIKMHRAVDRFTDSHEVFKNSRALIAQRGGGFLASLSISFSITIYPFIGMIIIISH